MSAVTSKSAITPCRSGRIARIVAGVRPIMRRASSPTAWTRPVTSSIATTDGSNTAIPWPRTKTSVFAVPRSIANSRLPVKRCRVTDPVRTVAVGDGGGRSCAEEDFFHLVRPLPTLPVWQSARAGGGSALVKASTELARGREAYDALAWEDAYECLSRVDKAAPLRGADLELLATSAHMLGRVDEWVPLLERAHHRHA